jgi:Protein of unknown function (DUF3160)
MFRSFAAASVLLAAACASSEPPELEPGQTPVDGVAPGDEVSRARFTQLAGEVERLRGSSADAVLSEYPMQHASDLGHAPLEAERLSLIQGSALALNGAELGVLAQNGFVISGRQQFPTFLRGYAAIYSEDLPVFVSADALLDALHRSYDAILSELETSVLIGALGQQLSHMLARIDGVEASEPAKQDLRMYLEVALGLLDPSRPLPTGAAARAFIQKARAATGIESVTLFGVERLEDLSQFEPRGHYAEPPLSDYFRAMIWLGRVDFRLLETLPDGTITFRRAQYEAMLALHQTLDERAVGLWSTVDEVVRAFVGESDSMTVPQVASLVADLGGPSAALGASDASVIDAINRGGYGQQQIASYLMVNDGVVPTLPLNRSFLLFGQRYVADSHVFSEVVYDRIDGRLMPSPLDAAFAALGNNQALALERSELESYPQLPGAMGAMRFLIDNHDASFWQANLYNLWSDSLRTLSPAPDSRDPEALGLPRIAGTEAWGRRLLNTQLGSWAQLKHDTLLYAKQSYTGIPGCEFPDAYVEPNPEFFHALVRFAERGSELMAALPEAGAVAQHAGEYFAQLATTSALLGQMAEQQKTGASFSAAQLAFINDAVRVSTENVGCTTVDVPDGWYADLFYQREKSIEQDLTIADVHTQPADGGGNIIGKVLHVGTGFPRLMALTVDSCTGPRAYVGMAYAYHERTTLDFERLTDEEWTSSVEATAPEDVPWMQGLVAP